MSLMKPSRPLPIREAALLIGVFIAALVVLATWRTPMQDQVVLPIQNGQLSAIVGSVSYVP
jgi:hypothetical protein